MTSATVFRSGFPGPRLRLALALLPLVGAGGCFSSCDDPPEARTGARMGGSGGPVASGQAPDPAAPGLSDAETQVARGEAIVQVDADGRVTVIANRYPRLGLLGKLSRQADFEQHRTRTVEGRSDEVTLSLVGGSVEEALRGILDGTDFHLHYAFDESASRTRLTRVTVGELTAGGNKRQQMRQLAARRGRELRSRASAGTRAAPSRVESARERSERLERRAREIEEGLTSGSDEVRAAAVDRLKPEGQELQKLKELLAVDPSPAVRATAAERLEGGFSGTAVDALIAALQDPDPTVVTTAIEALEFAAEAEHLPQILETGVTRHPDPEVRRVALEAVEFIED